MGSTELSSSMDAEEYSELIHAYQQKAVAIVRAFGGDVEGYSGDGILFRFGWPQAHDDDAIHALTAALDIVDAIAQLDEEQRLALRVGVHSGRRSSVCSVVPTGGPPWPWARRSTCRPASRGRPSRARWWPAPATIALVEGRFDVGALGPLRLRGVPQPVDAFLVLGRDRRPLADRR